MKSSISKFLALVMAVVMLMGVCAVAVADNTVYNDVPYKTVELDASDPNYYKALWEAGVYNYKMVRNFPTLYVYR